MSISIKNLILMVLMALAAVAAWAYRPTMLLADQRPKIELAQLVPLQFGSWHELQQSTGQIINPQQTELLQKLYTQTLSRTYIDRNGAVVMLSIAYGVNQSDGIALHYPEVCYPAQGFQLLSTTTDFIETPYGRLPVKRLMTELGNRSEPVTYWATLGDKAVQGGMQTKITQLNYGFKGQIPDGLIFRLSSISKESKQGYEIQTRFAQDLLAALPPSTRTRLYGLPS